MSYAAIVVGIGTLAYGAYKGAKAKKEVKNALGKRVAYQTPDEVFKILNATENRSQGDTLTRDYQTNQLDTSFANALDSTNLLGGDPNAAAALFGQKMQGIMQIGQQFHASNMEAFGKYLGALDMVAQNRAAEQGSQQNIVKDEIQAAVAEKAAANQTTNNGLNTLIGGISAYDTMQLYKTKKTAPPTGYTTIGGSGGSGGGVQGAAAEIPISALPVATNQNYGNIYNQTVDQQIANYYKWLNRPI